ncbi:reverse transcriptase-like protein [Bacillus sp. 123MFChir2]|uniref:reverse transcriptase-like protein n=1 Tax=Bacillus sp. 123MFChir2 TaxID=1169144 RepID=UPI00037FF804|nr:reverse transcriptase-like protein [Bacillus sp. 123MFChir2]
MIEVYIDGASKGNPGPSGAGVFIKGVQPPVQLAVPLGMMSNHEAEYHALLTALKYCTEHNYKIVSFRTDSQLVERAVEKQYVKNPLYAPLLDEALKMIQQFDLFFIKWIPSSQNKAADELARKAIQKNERR